MLINKEIVDLWGYIYIYTHMCWFIWLHLLRMLLYRPAHRTMNYADLLFAVDFLLLVGQKVMASSSFI